MLLTKIHTIIAGGTKWGKRGSGIRVPVILKFYMLKNSAFSKLLQKGVGENIVFFPNPTTEKDPRLIRPWIASNGGLLKCRILLTLLYPVYATYIRWTTGVAVSRQGVAPPHQSTQWNTTQVELTSSKHTILILKRCTIKN